MVRMAWLGYLLLIVALIVLPVLAHGQQPGIAFVCDAENCVISRADAVRLVEYVQALAEHASRYYELARKAGCV